MLDPVRQIQVKKVRENLGRTQILPKFSRKGAIPQEMDDGLLMVPTDGACCVGGNASISKSFPHRYIAMKAKPYEMLDFWYGINFPQPISRKDAGASSTISRQIISRGSTKFPILREFPN